jgi:carboxyl-terminal processing protease
MRSGSFRWLVLLGFTFTSLLAAPPLSAEIIPNPPSRNRQVAFYVNHFLTTQHLSRRAVDDELSQRFLKSFLEGLDPQKAYFLQSDIEKFEVQKEDLDDMMRNRDTQFAHDVYRVFLERVESRLEHIEELLQEELDFTVDEEILVDSKLLEYPQDDEEARDRWRKRIKYDLLILKSNEKTADEARKTLQDRYRTFALRTAQADEDDVLERFMNALASSYDPHSSYFSPGSFQDFRIRLGLNYEGIGAELDQKDGVATIRRIIPGGAAERAGELKANDQIISVGQGDEGELVDVFKMKLEHVIDMIRGREGSIVRLGVIPEGATEMRIYKITRARIELADSSAKGEILEHGTKDDGVPYRIGVIDLPSFYLDMDAARHGDENYKSSTRDVRRLIEQFKSDGIDAVVLDLRRNGGGSLTEAIGITGLFIDRGPVVQVKDSLGRVEVHSDAEPGTAWDGPLVVLTSRFSASASEILAGAIQDYQRGLVVGDESTHGKGTVQSLVEVGPTILKFENALNLGAIKITMQQFYRPNGDSTQNRGVLADVVLPSLSAHISKGESELDYAVEFDQVPAARFTKLDMIQPEWVAELNELSSARREEASDFQSLLEKIARYQEDVARKTMPLQEEKFLALRKRADAEKTAREQLDTLEHRADSKIKRDYYMDEVLAITADYVRLSQEASDEAEDADETEEVDETEEKGEEAEKT